MIMRLVAALAASLALLSTVAPALAQNDSAQNQDKPRYMYVQMKTNHGDLVIEVDTMRAPITAENFLTYVKDGFYDGTIFHRVIPGFVIQGGGFDKGMNKKPNRAPITNEWRNGLKNDRGTLSMARTNDPNSATSQFFVNLVDNARLDQPISGGAAYAVFAQVIQGMDAVDEIAKVKTSTAANGMSDVPVESVVVTSAKIIDVSEVDPDALAKAQERNKANDERIGADEAKLAGDKKKVAEIFSSYEAAKSGKEADGTLTESGVFYRDIVEGTGATPTPENVIRVNYTGWFPNGESFDSSFNREQPTEMALRRFIKGWVECVGTMKVGGKRMMVIPSELAYGAGGRPGIPPNSTLVFEVELLDIVK